MIAAAATASSRRQELAAFLRVRRDALTPESVGLALDDEVRHVPGLRREEVAELAGISTTWYTWLEQGRSINVSPDVLARIGEAMEMNGYEVSYMQRLASDAAPLTYSPKPAIAPVLRILVEKHEDAPAYIATPRFDLLAWNRSMSELMNYDAKSEPLARNILYRLFFDRSRRKIYADWETVANATVAAYRYMYSFYFGDKHFDDLLRKMLVNDDFSRMWESYRVAPPGLPPILIRHDTAGVCELTTVEAKLNALEGSYLAIFDLKRLS